MTGRLVLVAALFAPTLSAHAISMSTGQVTVTGSQVGYILRMPDYEMQGGGDPADLLFAHIRFSSGFETGRVTARECHHDKANANWLCAADYSFSAPVSQLTIECSLHEVTVANHVHVLRAERAGTTDRAILDSQFPTATLTFRPPLPFERALSQGLAAATRVCTGLAVLLLLFALAVASSGWIQLAAAAAAFLAAQVVVANLSWQVPPRFAEAAVALALAYLGLETMLFPHAGGRWLVAPLFGAFSGLYFQTFLFDSGYVPLYVLTGAVLASLGMLALLGAVVHFLKRVRRFLAGAVFTAGAVWFGLRGFG